MLNRDQADAYDRDGYVLVNNVFSPLEVDILLAHINAGHRVSKPGNMPDANGRSSKLSLWMDIADDVFGAVSANPRIVNSVRSLLREDAYHWHSKVMLKEARVGGAWEWHQDYGYWYGDGLLFPRLVSCMVALDRATRENGCLKVLTGSHLLGRLDHGSRGGQAGIDPERIAVIEQRLPLYYVEMEPGSALFFHSNTLHASEPNNSPNPRRAYICCYNGISNPPYGGRGHGKPQPIPPVAADAIQRFAISL